MFYIRTHFTRFILCMQGNNKCQLQASGHSSGSFDRIEIKLCFNLTKCSTALITVILLYLCMEVPEQDASSLDYKTRWLTVDVQFQVQHRGKERFARPAATRNPRPFKTKKASHSSLPPGRGWARVGRGWQQKMIH